MRAGRLAAVWVRFAAGLAALSVLAASSAQATPPPLSTYGRLPGFERAALSPTGQHVAVVATVDGKRMLMVMDAARKLVFTAGVGELKVRGIGWVGDRAVLLDYSKTAEIYGFTADKAELGTVAVVPIDGGKPWQVFANEPHITGGVWGNYGLVQRAGRWFGYFGGITLEQSSRGEQNLPSGKLRPDLYEVDMQTRQSRLVAHRPYGDGEDLQWLVDGSGTVAASLSLFRANGDWNIRNAAHQLLASGRNPLGDVRLDGLTRDGSALVYQRVDAAGGQLQRFSVPLAGGSPQPFLADKEVKSLIIGYGHRIEGYNDNTPVNGGHFFDPARDKAYQAIVRAFPGERVALHGTSQAFDHLLVITEGPADAGSWYLVDLASHHADPVGYSYAVDPEDVGPMKMLPYAAADGLKMEGVLTLPPPSLVPAGVAKNLPAVVLPHGGPFGVYDVAGFDWLAQGFASRGYAVFQPNFRGSGGYGLAFTRAGYGEWGKKMQSDISDGLAELVKQGVVDPRRVCIVGASYGGYAALAGVTLQQGLYRCAVSYAGVSDLNRLIEDKQYESNSDEMQRRNLKTEIGQGHDLKAISPIRLADKAAVPVLLIHGKDDTVVEFAQSSRMAEALRHAGKQVAFVPLPGEDHWLSKGETRAAMLQAAVDFVVANNPPGTPK